MGDKADLMDRHVEFIVDSRIGSDNMKKVYKIFNL